LAGLGNDAGQMTWSRIEKEMMEGILSFWGCRHLPEELTLMELCD